MGHCAFPSVDQGPCCSTPLSGLAVVTIFDFDHLRRCILVPCYLIWNSFLAYDIKHKDFHMFICHLLIFLGEVSIKINYLAYFLIGLFVFLLLSFKVVCVFWIIVLYQTWLLQIFSPNLWLIFSFFWLLFIFKLDCLLSYRVLRVLSMLSIQALHWVYNLQNDLSVCGFSFHFLNGIFSSVKGFNFDEVQILTLFFYGLYFWYILKTQGPNGFPLHFLLEIL
jgi:hypothetical protein